MKLSDHLREGIRLAIYETRISARQASLKAEFNENQVNRFLAGADMHMDRIERLCRKGFGLSFNKVYGLK